MTTAVARDAEVFEDETAHLANPLLAVSRLLASEAGAFARVVGDEDRFTIEVAVPAAERGDLDPWVRWAVHNAGVRGTVTNEGSG